VEFITILLSSLLGLVSPTGLVVEKVANNAVRSQFTKVEQLQVRVDNPPNHQLLQGKVQKVRIAGRGLQLKQLDMRLAVLELETDPIDLDISSLRRKNLQLEQPLQAGIRLVFNAQDINQALKSKVVVDKLQNLGLDILQTSPFQQERLQAINPRVEFLPNLVRLQVELTEEKAPPLAIKVEMGLNIIAGRQIQIVNPVVYVNQEKIPQQIVNAIARNLNKQLNLANLEAYGIQSKILKLAIAQEKLEIAGFVRLNNSSPLLKSLRRSPHDTTTKS
jgi:LmeA-like phospholipid-binding